MKTTPRKLDTTNGNISPPSPKKTTSSQCDFGIGLLHATLAQYYKITSFNEMDTLIPVYMHLILGTSQ